ncbi:hypothetical protein ACLB2K_045510 [Fragaria x ananassa]
MPTVEVFITLLFFFFFVFLLPNQISASTTNCRKSKCMRNEPPVHFPFRLGDRQATYCGYGQGFNLSCSLEQRTILSLSYSGDFIVRGIDYDDQLVWIDDPENCFPKRLLDGDFSLMDSPFTYLYGLENFTFLNCSSQAEIRSSPIPCLSDQYYGVLVVPSSWFYGDPNSTSTTSSLSPASLSPLCSVISTALVPRSSPADPWDINIGVPLAWDMPECRSCQGSSCGFENSTSSQIVCTGDQPSHSGSGMSNALRYAIVIGCAVPALVCIIGVIICAYKMNASNNQARQPAVTELSTVVSQQLPNATAVGPPTAVRMGLDGETIESYPKTQLGESLELPNPNDKTCSICLCEYQHREIIRTIPQCKHYFHANCIDEWFKKDVTCPLCRDLPNYEALALPRPPLHDTSALPSNGSLDLPRPVLQNTANFLYLDHMYLM